MTPLIVSNLIIIKHNYYQSGQFRADCVSTCVIYVLFQSDSAYSHHNELPRDQFTSLKIKLLHLFCSKTQGLIFMGCFAVYTFDYLKSSDYANVRFVCKFKRPRSIYFEH